MLYTNDKLCFKKYLQQLLQFEIPLMTIKDKLGFNPWHIAIQCKDTEIIELLINFHIKHSELVHSSDCYPSLTIDDLLLLLNGKF